MTLEFKGLSLSKPRSDLISQILYSALSAVEPGKIVQDALKLDNGSVWIEGMDQGINLDGKIVLIGAGKASFRMMEGAVAVFGEKINYGTIITKIPPMNIQSRIGEKIHVLVGDHPIPGLKSVEATREVLSACQGLKNSDIILFLISGGASALMTFPQIGVDLSEIQQMTQILLRSGAEINEINTLRKHLDIIKGGGLVRNIFPAKTISLAISDVIGDSPSVIGSGPTVADASTFQDAIQIIEKYHLQDTLPSSIMKTLWKGIHREIPETIKPGDPILENCFFRVIGSNEKATKAAVSKATSLGFRAINLGSNIQGEARIVAADLTARLKAYEENSSNETRPVCLIGGGETTVTCVGKGRGGRNLETALAAVEGISGMDGACLVTLATDGEDGTTGMAGAIIANDTFRKGIDLGLNPGDFLAENNSLSYFEKVGGLMKTGSTGTNVMDMFFLFLFKNDVC